MKMFEPKAGPVFTRGRFQHALVGEHIILVGGVLGGYGGLAWGLLVMAVVAFVWEWGTPVLARWAKWAHPWGDVVDLVAYFVGGIVGAVLALGLM